MPRKAIRILLAAGAFISMAALAAPLTGRLVDTMEAVVFSGAQVRLVGTERSVKTDSRGFFRFADVNSGGHWLDIALPDGRNLRAHVLIGPGQGAAYTEFDLARIVPPDDDADY